MSQRPFIRPMLAPNKLPSDLSKLHYPLMCSIKMDGVRCLITPEGAKSRNGKQFPNEILFDSLEPLIELASKYDTIFDGELWGMDEESALPIEFQKIMSCVRSQHGAIPTGMVFNAFDAIAAGEFSGECPRAALVARQDRLRAALGNQKEFVNIVDQAFIDEPEEVQDLFGQVLEAGHEGLILRRPQSKYKQGRATWNEGTIYKLKPENVGTGKVLGVQALQRMSQDYLEGDREVDELGYLKRSYRNSDKEFVELLGSLSVSTIGDGQLREGILLSIGSGFTMSERRALWRTFECNPREVIGRLVEFKYCPVGMKVAPRFPIFLRFRN